MLWIKLIILNLILVSSTIIGITFSKKYTYRVKELQEMKIEVVDIIPYVNRNREEEIQAYLEKHQEIKEISLRFLLIIIKKIQH